MDCDICSNNIIIIIIIYPKFIVSDGRFLTKWVFFIFNLNLYNCFQILCYKTLMDFHFLTLRLISYGQSPFITMAFFCRFYFLFFIFLCFCLLGCSSVSITYFKVNTTTKILPLVFFFFLTSFFYLVLDSWVLMEEEKIKY